MRSLIVNHPGRQVLKTIHLLFCVIWIGAAISMNILRLAWPPAVAADVYAVDHAISLIDHWVVLPCAFGALLTGLLSSWLTSWGFFRYPWVKIKWIVTLAIMVLAPIFQAPRISAMERISASEGLRALQNPLYLEHRQVTGVFAVLLIGTLVGMTVLSVFKPGRKKSGEWRVESGK